MKMKTKNKGIENGKTVLIVVVLVDQINLIDRIVACVHYNIDLASSNSPLYLINWILNLKTSLIMTVPVICLLLN